MTTTTLSKKMSESYRFLAAAIMIIKTFNFKTAPPTITQSQYRKIEVSSIF